MSALLRNSLRDVCNRTNGLALVKILSSTVHGLACIDSGSGDVWGLCAIKSNGWSLHGRTWYSSAAETELDPGLHGIVHGTTRADHKTAVAPQTTTNIDYSRLLRSIRAADFHPHLQMLKRSRKVLKYTELLKEFERALPYSSDKDAEFVIEALSESGNVLISGDLVYLHPDEIAKTMRQLLPVDVRTLMARLQEVEDELIPMDKVKKMIENKSERRTRYLNYSFLGVMAAQWLVFFRLCYWEYGWDVIEPVGYFTNGATTILAFSWFLHTRRDFTYEEMANKIMSSYEKKAFEDIQFDFVEYNRLRNEAQRLKEAIASYHHV